MDMQERERPWLKRVEALAEALEGSTVSELELREAGTEIIIRRRPDLVLTPAPQVHQQQDEEVQPLVLGGTRPLTRREDRSVAVVAPLTGIYYAAPSPTAPPFVNPGEIISVGQVVALVEAMKIFNEIQAEVAGRVIALVAQNGEVVQKGAPLLKVEPLM